MGYSERWVRLVTIYPPCAPDVMAGALGISYNPGMSMGHVSREVRVNNNQEIEVWERRVETIKPGLDQYKVNPPR